MMADSTTITTSPNNVTNHHTNNSLDLLGSSSSDGEATITSSTEGPCFPHNGGARSAAYQLAKMRVVHTGASGSSGGKMTVPSTPVTPATPVAMVTTPSTFFSLSSRLCSQDDCVHQDLQLAAELGKTLLERNRELEGTIRQQQTVVDDRMQEIEYLSKQTAALREVNDSRLRIYEQLEISIQDLEKTNQRLNSEASADRKKIRNLCSTIEALEARNEELSRSVEEARGAGLAAARGRHNRRVQLLDEAHRRSLSCENSGQEERHSGDEDSGEGRAEKLAAQVKDLQSKLAAETGRREEVEVELGALSQEHEVLQQHVAVLRERQDAPLRTFQDELAALEDSSEDRLCRKCLGSVDDTASNPGTVYELSESIEDGGEPSIPSERGGCALVRLSNGAMAWGSQESLASMGQVMSQVSSSVTSPATDVSEAPHNSLLSELDTQYRILIEKYEALLVAREQQDQQQLLMQTQQQQQSDSIDHSSTFIPSEAEEMSGPMSLVMANNESCPSTVMRCQRCSTCSCGIAGAHQRPKSNMEEFSEVETSSSGFSEGESRLFNKTTQTDCLLMDRIDESTPTAEMAMTPAQFLDLKSPVNPCDKRFQAAPEYKKLFQEIFTVLKKTVDENDESCQQQQPDDSTGVLNLDETDSTAVYETPAQTVDTSSTMGTVSESVTSGASNIDDINEQDVVNMLKNVANSVDEHNDVNSSSNMELNVAASDEDKMNRNSSESDHILRPIRPNSLDLVSNGSSRSSSKHRRRKKQQKIRIESSQLKQQQQELNEQQKLKADQEMAALQKQSTSQQASKPSQPKQQEGDGIPKVPKSNSNYSNLCEKHRQQQSRRKSRRNRSRNSSNHRLPAADQEQRENINPGSGAPTSSSGGAEEHLSNGPSAGESSNNTRRRPPKSSSRPQSSTNGPEDYRDYYRDRRDCRDYYHRRGHDSPGKTPGPSSARAKMTFPSVEVAKLRKLEMTYAEVLKSQMQRAANRKH